VLGVPEDVRSSFQQWDLPTWTLRLLSQVHGVHESDIPGLLVNTFGGYTASRSSPSWIGTTEAEVQAFVRRLVDSGLAEREGDVIHLTLLGRACGASSLSFESGLRLVELIKQLDASQAQSTSLLAVVQVLPEMDAIYTPVFKKGRSESVRVNDVVQRYGPMMPRALQRYCRDQVEFLSRCKRAALLYDWIGGTPVETLERHYSTTPFQGAIGYGDITRIGEGTRFHMRSARQIMTALFPERPEFLAGVDELLERLEFGLPTKALALARLPVQLTRGQHLALFDAGCFGAEDIRHLTQEQLRACVGPAAAELLARAGFRTQETAAA
jgi:helicase